MSRECVSVPPSNHIHRQECDAHESKALAHPTPVWGVIHLVLTITSVQWGVGGVGEVGKGKTMTHLPKSTCPLHHIR